MSDVTLALVVAAVVAVIFVSAALASRRAPDPLSAGRLDHIDDRITAVEKSVGQAQHDLSNVRMIVNNLPTKEAVHRMELEVTALSGKVGRVEAEVSATSRAVERVEDLLLKRIGT